ncbi:methyltransferase domain-containing protein [Novosphingobium ginsenosidimutans]|uniref:Class I SAM-dependent methyltransferase n=1 Tax=Novosphingobium ginsenosidimutans TaxID=1176536 RepID=A0A5B8RYG8_9SPHN|nr:methyltransferase domain-containing protein [Novosphingobium ginsenosidimutans]QEA14639.1 class I SAM-dependent methyltransferase [Novosphingobium ginsenosidimutans]QEA17393.1 class I SAM-dependent methyltransferase [Novosphingobium ginsenosidimutans]
MLISKEYRAMNADLHAGGSYGHSGQKWAEAVTDLVARYRATSVLDYGCGQGTLAKAVDFPICEFDPAIVGKDRPPLPVDLVVCTDVLEHIEPDCLDDVLDHLYSLSRLACFVVVSTRPARKILADGRNAHLIIEDDHFWRRRIEELFAIREWTSLNQEFAALLEPLRGLPAIKGRTRRAWRRRLSAP